MYQLNEKELLVKSSMYAVQREKLFIPIYVYKKIAGKPSKADYQAIPTGSDAIAPEAYCGFGDSEEEALQKCLELIHDVDDNTIRGWFFKKPNPDKSGNQGQHVSNKDGSIQSMLNELDKLRKAHEGDIGLKNRIEKE